ncbi:hypothetical protein [Sanguibacter sp. 25GB23B1]|uniref:hypothetical protein n=1 Tax=unclassified Sanguibacter TaxID=2645534 RepID=UPI0032AEA6E9
MNDLIVETTTPSTLSCMEGLRIVGPAIAIVDSFERESAFVFAAGAASVATDIAEFVVDPIAAIGASAASFAMEYFAPLREALDSVTGNALAVQAQAQTWMKIADQVTESAESYTLRTATALTGWEGPAATGYRTFVASYTQILGGVGTLCSQISSTMVGASAVVGFVRTIVRETIADLVGKLISWAARIYLTGGLGATWVVPEAARTIALYVKKVQAWIKDLTDWFQKLAQALKDMNNSLDLLVPVLARIRQSVDIPLVPLGTTRAANRNTPNVQDLVPVGFTMMTNSASSGLRSGLDAAKEPE